MSLRIESSPEVSNLRPAKGFYPAHDLLLPLGRRPFFFNDRYAAINCRNDSQLIFWYSQPIRPEKGLNFLAKSFFILFLFFAFDLPKKGLSFWRIPFFLCPLEWWQPTGTLLGLKVAHQFKKLPTPGLAYTVA